MHVGWSWYPLRPFAWRSALGAVVAAATTTACTTVVLQDPTRTAALERAEQLVATHCEAADACECAVTVAQAGCEANLGDRWRARVDAGQDRGLTYDAECMDAIEASIDEAMCAWPADDDGHPCNDFCQVYHGKRELGSSCTRFDDLVSNCAQGLLCHAGRCTAPCTALGGLGEGEQCRDPATFEDLDRCGQNLVCAGDTGRCLRAPAVGEPCPNGLCDDAGYCDWNEPNQRCQPRVGEGANCEQAECQSGLDCVYVEDAGGYFATCRPRAQAGEVCFEVGCDDGLDCGPDGLCRARGELGADCSFVGCVDGLLCNYDIMRCAEPPAAGLPCLSGECAPGAWCDNSLDFSLCVAGLPLGDACTGHRQCATGFCPAGFCDARPALGESCAGTLVCEVGASCDGRICRPSVTRGPAVCVYQGW